ncbi:hypothetical protein AB0I28_00065 [Phytomonospora sp. NPDC050363]|uniref:hypothetical protein n=1 Tax=Phytomonospora sp. NPDC050363 TaxID=3155642 RepID=UPI0033DC9149
MDFTALKAAVDGQYDANRRTFSFDPAPYGSSDIDRLLADVIDLDSWDLTGAAPPVVDSTAQTVTVAGTCAEFSGRDSASLTMLFHLAGEQAELAVRMDLGTGWSFVETFPALAGTVFESVAISAGTQPAYVFASDPFTWPGLDDGEFATGMNFYAKVEPAATDEPWRGVTALLGSFAATTAVGPISILGDLPQMSLGLGYVGVLTDYFPILKGRVEARLVSDLQEATNQAGLMLATSFDLGPDKGLRISTILKPQLGGLMTFYGDFTGVKLPTPSEAAQALKELIGADDLYSSLPDPYQSGSGLELRRLTLGISTVDLTPMLASLDIGMPPDGPGWPLGDLATVTDVQFTATVLSPFDSTNRTLSVTVSGGLELPTTEKPVEMVAQASATFTPSKPGEYRVQAGLAPGTDLTLPVKHLTDEYLPGVVGLPDIVFNRLGVDFKFASPANHYGMYAGLDPANPLVFRFGGVEVFEVLYADFHIENDSYKGGPGGGMVGAMTLFGLRADITYQAPGDFRVTALVPEFTVSMQTLADRLLGPGWALPGWMPDITFPKTSLLVERQGAEKGAAYTFAMMAKPSFGTLITQVEKQPSGWVFAGALQLDTPKIAAFSGLSELAGMDAMFAATELLFVFVSGDLDSGFHFPPTADFEGETGPDMVIPSFAGPVKAGFYFFGEMKLNLAGQPNLALVQHLLGLDVELAFQLLVFIGMDPRKNAYAQAGVQGRINDVTTLSGYLGARMESGEPSFYLEGVVTTSVQGTDGANKLVSCDKPNMNDCLKAGVAFELTPNAAYLSVSLIGSVVFGPVTLSNVVIVVGIDWELIPSLGFAAQIDLNAYGTTYDSSIALFFDSGDPSKSLFAGSISDVTLKQVADTIVGAVSGKDVIPEWLDELLAQVGVSGTSKVTMPATAAAKFDGRDFAGITAAFNAAYKSTSYSFTAENTLLVVGATDLDKPGVWYLTNFPASDVIKHYQVTTGEDGTLHASLEPQFYYCMPPGGGTITLGPPSAGLTFNPGVYVAGTLDFFMLHLAVQLEVKQNQGFAVDVELTDPVDVLDGYLQLTGNEDRTRGPRFSMSTYPVQGIDPVTKQPATLPAHFYFDGRLVFLDLEVASTVNVSSAGLLLHFMAKVGDESLGASFDFDSTVDTDTGVTIDFAAEVHIHDPEFKLFDVRLGTLDLNAAIAIGMSFHVGTDRATLHMGASEVTIGDFTFDLPSLDLDVSVQELGDIAGIVYDELKNLIWDFLQYAEHWLEWIRAGLVSGYEAIEKVLNDVYNALASVWGNEKFIVIATRETLVASQSITVTIDPPTPRDGVTQAMIDSAETWAHQQAETLVEQAVVERLKKTSPDDVANFRIDSVQDIDADFNLDQNVNWFPVARGPLPTLTSLGFTDPMKDPRFCAKATGTLNFHTAVAVDADFATTVARVSVSVRYNGAQVGTPYIFTNAAAHTWTTAWVAAAADNFQVQYTVTWLNPAIQPVTSPWLDQKGPSVVLPIIESEHAEALQRAR